MSSEATDHEEISAVHSYDSPPPSNQLTRNSFPRRRIIRRFSINCFSSRLDDQIEYPNVSYVDPPPSYSSIYANEYRAIGNRGPFLLTNHSSFVAPVPPPSYAQAEGISTATFSTDESLSFPNTAGRWLPWPITAICPRCVVIVVTVIEVRRSVFTHLMAVLLFLIGCWPCCLLPYCMTPCKITDHYCPTCRTYLGTYKPW